MQFCNIRVVLELSAVSRAQLRFSEDTVVLSFVSFWFYKNTLIYFWMYWTSRSRSSTLTGGITMHAFSHSIYSLNGRDVEVPGMIGIAPTRSASARRLRNKEVETEEPLCGSGGGTKANVERDNNAARLDKEPHIPHSDLKFNN